MTNSDTHYSKQYPGNRHKDVKQNIMEGRLRPGDKGQRKLAEVYRKARFGDSRRELASDNIYSTAKHDHQLCLFTATSSTVASDVNEVL